MNAKPRGTRTGSWMLPWILANTLGFTAGGTIAGAAQRDLLQPYFEVVTSAAEAARVESRVTGLTLAIFGALIGLAQWLILRRRIRAGWWMAATCLGWAVGGSASGALGGVLGGRVSTIGPEAPLWIVAVVGLPAALLVGLLFGTFQWLVLRGRVERAGAWPLGNLAGLVLGFAGGFAVVRCGMVDVVPLLRPEDFPSARAVAAIGAVAGTVYGAVTWPILRALSPQIEREPGADGRR